MVVTMLQLAATSGSGNDFAWFYFVVPDADGSLSVTSCDLTTFDTGAGLFEDCDDWNLLYMTVWLGMMMLVVFRLLLLLTFPEWILFISYGETSICLQADNLNSMYHLLSLFMVVVMN